MHHSAKKILTAATKSEYYWKLSESEKLIWMIEHAYHLGRRDALKAGTKGRIHGRRDSGND